MCARLNPGGLRGRGGERTPERIVSSLVSPQLLPFSVRGAEWPRQSRGPARGEARAVSRKAVRGSSRELRVAETGVGAQTEAPPPRGVWSRRAEPARFSRASVRFGADAVGTSVNRAENGVWAAREREAHSASLHSAVPLDVLCE